MACDTVLAGDKDAGVRLAWPGGVCYRCADEEGRTAPDIAVFTPKYASTASRTGRSAPTSKRQQNGEGLTAARRRRSGELRLNPTCPAMTERPRRERVSVLGTQPPRGQQPWGDLRQRCQRGQLGLTTAVISQPRRRLHAGERRHGLTGGLIGWVCPEGIRPRGEDFGANESRADYYYFVCGVPTPRPTRVPTYCCFTPSPVLPAARACTTPVVHLDHRVVWPPVSSGSRVTGATPPTGIYLPDECKEPPVQGISDDGYPAKLYCCDYVPPGVGSGTGSGLDEDP